MFRGGDVSLIVASSIFHGSACCAQQTEAFRSIHSEIACSPAKKFIRPPQPTRSSIPKYGANRQPNVNRRVDREASPVTWRRILERSVCRLGGLPFFGGAAGDIPIYSKVESPFRTHPVASTDPGSSRKYQA